MNNNRKLIFFDIDGTLVTEGRDPYVPESTYKTIRKLRENGHLCVINTGRPFSALDQAAKSIETDGYICSCGSYITVGGDVLFSFHLDKQLCTEILNELDRCGLEWLLESDDAVYYSDREYTTPAGKEISSWKDQLKFNVRCINSSEYQDIQFEKFLMILTEKSDKDRFFLKFADRLTFIDKGNGLYEVVSGECSKASGMKFLENYFDISNEDTICVGDSVNDITMFEYAAFSVLMGNADPSLHIYADLVTTDIADDGIYNAFSTLGLI